ncbi:MAG: hypothetical protein ABI594_05020 [Ginsengibacter sp.]
MAANHLHSLLSNFFAKETYNTNASWRIFRIITLIDLIVKTIIRYNHNANETLLFKIISYCVMLKYNLERDPFELSEYYKNSLLDSEISNIVKDSKEIFGDFENNKRDVYPDFSSQIDNLKSLRNSINKSEINRGIQEVYEATIQELEKYKK